MKPKILYQTLEDRGNSDDILKNAPFYCDWENTWLGEGYYFWDTFIENAHWWGGIRYKKKYIISRMICDFNTSDCFDLVGETEHMLEFNECLDFLKEEKIIDPTTTTVSRVLSYLKNDSKLFNYQAIRAYGVNSNSKLTSNPKLSMKFELSKGAFLDLRPAIQICIFDKTGLNLRDLRIDYPDEYNNDY